MLELPKFFLFLKRYAVSRLYSFGTAFENLKDVVVALLVVKRGKYSTSFLNTSFVILVITVIVGAPAIAENASFGNSLNETRPVYAASVVTVDPFENPVTTNSTENLRPRDSVISYLVREGETIGSIAQKFNISIDTVKWANNLKTDTIKIGQSLKILPVSGVAHAVQSGENVYSIAKKYSTSAQNIVNFPFNDFADLDTFQLTPGQTLIIPDGVIEEAKPIYENQGRYFAQIQAGVKGTSTFIWPTSGGITQYPVWYHMALDIANAAAPPVLASDTGTVTFAGCIQYGYGCHIILDHGNGYQTLYGHLSSINVSPGQAVEKGQTIGVMGSSGRSTGTHLHFEVRSGGTLLNPLNFLQ